MREPDPRGQNKAFFPLLTGSRPDVWSWTPEMSGSVDLSRQINLCEYLVCLLTQNIHEVTMVQIQFLQLRILDLLARHQVGSTGRWKATSTKMSPPSPYRTRIPTWNPLVWHQESRFTPDAGPNTCPKIGQTWRPKSPVHSPPRTPKAKESISDGIESCLASLVPSRCEKLSRALWAPERYVPESGQQEGRRDRSF